MFSDEDRIFEIRRWKNFFQLCYFEFLSVEMVKFGHYRSNLLKNILKHIISRWSTDLERAFSLLCYQ